MNNIWILIPAYNVQRYIREVLMSIPKSMWNQNAHVLVIDDSSEDQTAKIVKAQQKKYKNLHIIQKKHHEGYAKAQKSGFDYSLKHSANIVVILHGDGQYNPEELPMILSPLVHKKADIVIGSRILGGKALQGGMPPVRYVANRILTYIENIVFGLHFAEYHSGYMAYSGKTLKKLPYDKLTNGFHIDGEMLMLGAKMNLNIQEVPISTHYSEQKSHLNPIAYIFDIALIVWKYKRGAYDQYVI